MGYYHQFKKNFLLPFLLCGHYYYENNDYLSSLKCYQSLTVLTNNNVQSFINLRLGQSHYSLESYDTAIYYLNLVEENCSLSNDSILNESYYYLGLSCSKNYRYEKSLYYYLKNVSLSKRLYGDSALITGITYCDLGNVYYNLENYELAIQYYNYAKNILLHQPLHDIPTLSIIINNLGSTHYRKGNYSKAIEYFQEALRLNNSIQTDYYNLSMFLNNIGGIYTMLNELDSAGSYYEKSLSIRQKHLNNSRVLTQSYNQLAFLNIKKENYINSLSYIQKAIASNTVNYIEHSVDANPSFSNILDYWQIIESLYYKAIVLFELSQDDNSTCKQYQKMSLNTFKALLDYFDKIYSNYLTEKNYINLLAFNREILNTAIDISYRINNYSEEFIYTLIEKGRSIKLFQSYVESEAKKFANVPDSLLILEKIYNDEIIEIDYKLSLLEKNGEVLNSPDYYNNQIYKRNAIINKLDSLVLLYEKNYPKYYFLKYDFSSFNLVNLMKLIPDSSAIIEYFITDSLIYGLLISNNHLKLHCGTNENLNYFIKEHNNNIKFYNNAISETGKELYKILIKPFEFELSKINTLKIIPDLNLSLLPFETLVIDKQCQESIPKYLIYDFYISYQFSSTLYARSISNNHKYNIVDELNLIAFAPIIGDNTYCDSVGIFKYKSLPFSKSEVQGIYMSFVDKSLDSKICLGKNATIQSLVKNSKKYSIIHLSTHGIFNESDPEYSGILLYDNFKNAAKDMKCNLRIFNIKETYNLQLNAKLVVLSSCKSGIGKRIKGDGMYTLYRGLYYAGAQNIIFSIWQIGDKTTAVFMNIFYNYILKGCNFISALRKTKLHFINNSTLTLPIYWSNYLLLGN